MTKDNQVINTANIENNVEEAVNLLKALSNEKRLLIVCTLCEQEKSVGELEEIIGLSQSALSQHLARLRRDGILKTRREAQTIYYSILNEEACKLLHAISECYPSLGDDA